MRIYLASSWKNEELVRLIARILRRDGHEVDCFCDSTAGRYVFKWTEHFDNIDQVNIFNFLELPAAKKAFEEDKKWIDWCDAMVMIFPCGNSSHLEAGYAKGSGKRLFIWGSFPPGYFENMYGFADMIFGEKQLDDLRMILRGMKQ